MLERNFSGYEDIDLVTTSGHGIDASKELMSTLLDNVAAILYSEKEIWDLYSRYSEKKASQNQASELCTDSYDPIDDTLSTIR